LTSYLNTPKGKVIIRIATIEDAAALLALRLEALRRHPEAFAADADKTAAGGETAWAEQIREYGSTQSGAICIAQVMDELIGMSGIVRGHWQKTAHGGTLWGVYVVPDWRGYKIGEAIVNGCIEWAIEHELTVITLGVTDSNLAAIRCYNACGFTSYGLAPRVILNNGRYYDELLMAKQI
jgi:RimJ/RimL family protein N-acetyltransferase